jgi:hypothetical protein
MNAQRRGGIYLVPSHPDQDDVDYFARAWKELSQPENPPALPTPKVMNTAIRASSLSPSSLQALLGFAVGSKRYEPGEIVNCEESPSLAEALVRLGYASRMPGALSSGNRVSQGARANAKERLKKALADVASSTRQKRCTT